jgi:YggT family protein
MYSFIRLLNGLVQFYEILVLVWCIMSWFPRPNGGILQDVEGAIDSLVSPYVNLFRRWVPPLGGIDFSPWIAMIALELALRLVVRLLVLL